MVLITLYSQATVTSLFAVGGLLVEMLALYVLKEKDIYKKAKYEQTEEMGKNIFAPNDSQIGYGAL